MTVAVVLDIHMDKAYGNDESQDQSGGLLADLC